MTKNYISNKDETPRMFESDVLEAFSKVHWTVPLWLYIPVVIFFLHRSIYKFELNYEQIILIFLLGIFFWTFTEYSLHRFVFHFQPKSKFGKRMHFIFHGVHHDYPNDSRRLVMPPSASIPLASLFYLLFLTLLGVSTASPFFAGFITGYIYYDITHYAIHHFNMHGKFWLFIKNHHILHHYKEPDLGFGVSQPLWDYVFKTNFQKKNIRTEAVE